MTETAAATEPRPFNILGLQQIAIGGLDLKALMAFFVDLLGFKFERIVTMAAENVTEAICSIGVGLARVEIDLMQPLNPDAKPAVHIPPLNHIGFWVDDLEAAVEFLTARGVRFTGEARPGAAGFEVTFIHPKSACSILIELVQAPEGVIRGFQEAAASAQ